MSLKSFEGQCREKVIFSEYRNITQIGQYIHKSVIGPMQLIYHITTDGGKDWKIQVEISPYSAFHFSYVVKVD